MPIGLFLSGPAGFRRWVLVLDELDSRDEECYYVCHSSGGYTMARLAKDFSLGEYLARTSFCGGDLERMSVHARRVYLQRHLYAIEEQIRVLSERLNASSERPESRVYPWGRGFLDLGKMDSISSLNYLFAVRAMLRTAIETL